MSQRREFCTCLGFTRPIAVVTKQNNSIRAPPLLRVANSLTTYVTSQGTRVYGRVNLRLYVSAVSAVYSGCLIRTLSFWLRPNCGGRKTGLATYAYNSPLSVLAHPMEQFPPLFSSPLIFFGSPHSDGEVYTFLSYQIEHTHPSIAETTSPTLISFTQSRGHKMTSYITNPYRAI